MAKARQIAAIFEHEQKSDDETAVEKYPYVTDEPERPVHAKCRFHVTTSRPVEIHNY